MNWGGPPTAVIGLIRGLSKLGVSCTVVTLDENPFPRFPFPVEASVRFAGDALFPKIGIPNQSRLLRTLHDEVAKVDLVHLHELWHAPQLIGSLLSKLARKPYIISPHGAIEPFVGGMSVLKFIAWHAYQRLLLESASAVHAVNSYESRLLTMLLRQDRIPVIPNGVDLAQIDRYLGRPGGESFSVRRPASPFILFLGRLIPKKGIDLVLESFRQIADEFPEL